MSAAIEAQDPAAGGGPPRALNPSSLGALANTGASVLRLTCQLAVLPILARLIAPAEYGLVALAMPVILLANVIADGGVVTALARQREAGRTVESTAFWVTVGLGLALALGTCATAFPIGWTLRQPRLPWLILALSPLLLMNSIMSVSNGRIIRERRFVTFALGDIFATLTGAATALTAASHGWGAWSLVAQQLVFWACKMVWIMMRGGAQVGFVFRYREVRDLVTFAANNIGATIADFVSRNIDNFIIGGALGATSLGYYAMAYQVIRVPDMLITSPFWLYLFTAMSRAAHQADLAAIRDLARAGLRLSAVALAPLYCGLALVADLAVPLFLGPKWSGTIGPLRLLAAAGFAFCACSLMAAMLLATNKAALQLRLAIALGLATIVAVGGAVRFGLDAAAGALACGVVAVALYYVDQLARELATTRAALLGALAPALTGCLALSLTVGVTREALHGRPASTVLAAAVAAGAAAYAAVVWLVARRRLAADVQAFSRAHADDHRDLEAAARDTETALRPLA
jgi:PST family polysaccharide transporter